MQVPYTPRINAWPVCLLAQASNERMKNYHFDFLVINDRWKYLMCISKKMVIYGFCLVKSKAISQNTMHDSPSSFETHRNKVLLQIIIGWHWQ